ncbi:hypothetical protein HK096_011317, partial [Nowakowskiella sp. JEL0078]
IEIHSYGKANSNLIFISNTSPSIKTTFKIFGKQINIPAWSVSIAYRQDSNFDIIYNTAIVETTLPLQLESSPAHSPARSKPSEIHYAEEYIPFTNTSRNDPRIHIFSLSPLEQIRTTNDSTDYLWYISDPISIPKTQTMEHIKLSIVPAPTDYCYVWLGDDFVGQSVNPETQSLMNWLPWLKRLVLTKSRLTKNDDTSLVRVRILCTSVGINHWGNQLEKVIKGVRSKAIIKVGGVSVKKWTHVVGLLGENEKYSILPSTFETLTARLIWYKLKIPVPQLIQDTVNNKFSAFVLDLSSMGKGFAWIENHGIGRYWSIRASWPEKNCLSELEIENFIGGKYNTDKRNGCGDFTQRYYHVPADWIDGKESVDVTIFEEIVSKLNQNS